MAGGLWYSETEVYSGSGLADNFATAVADDMKLGLVFVSDGNLLYKDFDGAAWSGNFSLDDEITVAPVLKYNGSIPFVFYGKDIGDNQNQLFYVSRSGSGFASPKRVCGEVSAFDKALCYRPSATVKYYDRSSAAADNTAGDVYHVESGKLIEDEGDALFIGQSEKFQHARIVLSTNGVGGAVGLSGTAAPAPAPPKKATVSSNVSTRSRTRLTALPPPARCTRCRGHRDSSHSCAAGCCTRRPHRAGR